jgi:anti-sigma regulatory factor (Ser/Thr protein kinase)
VVCTRDRLDLRLPARPESLAAIRAELRRWLDGFARADETNDLLLALGEASTNAVEHGSHASDAWMQVRARLLFGTIVRLTVRNSGHWRVRADAGENRGRGFVLMCLVVDKLAVRHHPDETEVIIYKVVNTTGVPRATIDPVSEEARHPG